MSLTEAIITYHDLLTDEIAADSHEQLTDQMRSRGLFFGERPLCSVLRPRFLTPEQYAYMRQAIRPLLRAFEKISHRAVADAGFRAQFGLFDWEESRGPDGFSIGPDGKLYVTAGTNFPSATETNRYRSGVYVINHQKGGLEKFLAVPEDMITNCTWGGEEGKTLFITAGHKLWSLSWEAIHENQSFSR